MRRIRNNPTWTIDPMYYWHPFEASNHGTWFTISHEAKEGLFKSEPIFKSELGKKFDRAESRSIGFASCVRTDDRKYGVL